MPSTVSCIDGCEVMLSSSHKIVDENIKNSSTSILSADTKSRTSSMSSRSSSRSEASTEEREREEHKKDEPPEFLIVLLGDKLDRDPTSWHG